MGGTRKDCCYCTLFTVTLAITVALGTISIWGSTYLAGWEAWDAASLYTKVSVISVGAVTLVMLATSIGFLVFLCRRREKRRLQEKDFIPLVGGGGDENELNGK